MTDTFWLQLSDHQRHPYKLVKSKRAKYIRIKISGSGELSVVLPWGILEKHAHGFIQKKSQWIAKTIKAIPEKKNNSFPKMLNLKLLDELWHINYVKHSSVEPVEYTPPVLNRVELLEASNHKLEINGGAGDWTATKKVLNMWCKQKAKMVFTEMLEILAEQHGFHFNKISIRSQKTRWGSCASNKNISLNSKLLLMPENVVKYVMIHELCHTIEMNHSSKFWHLVEDCDPNYKENRKQLKLLGQSIPL